MGNKYRNLRLCFITVFSLCSLLFFLFEVFPDYTENIKKAEELFLQLKKWQEEKDWENYFSSRKVYQEKIRELLEGASKSFPEKIKAKFLLWQVYVFLGDKKASFYKEDFLRTLKELNPEKDSISILKEIIEQMNETTDAYLKKKVFEVYLKLLKSSPPEFLKKEADSFYEKKDISTSLLLYKELMGLKGVFSIEDLFELIKKFSCDGLKDECEPYFTDEVFKKIKESQPESLTEGWYYLWGYNLERGFEFKKALEVYKTLLENFPQGVMKEEVIFRIGYIYMYKLRDFSQAKVFFERLNKGSIFGQAVKKNLAYLLQKGFSEELKFNEKLFLETLLGKKRVLSEGALVVRSYPSRLLIDKKTEVKSITGSYGTGCLDREGLFLWSGDLGDISISTNTSQLFTSFNQEGLKIIRVVEKLPGGVLDEASELINVYKIEVSLGSPPFKTQKEVVFSLNISPPLAKELLEFLWIVEGPQKFESKEETPLFIFKKPGSYSLFFSLKFLGNKFYSKKYSFIVE